MTTSPVGGGVTSILTRVCCRDASLPNKTQINKANKKKKSLKSNRDELHERATEDVSLFKKSTTISILISSTIVLHLSFF